MSDLLPFKTTLTVWVVTYTSGTANKDYCQQYPSQVDQRVSEDMGICTHKSWKMYSVCFIYSSYGSLSQQWPFIWHPALRKALWILVVNWWTALLFGAILTWAAFLMPLLKRSIKQKKKVCVLKAALSVRPLQNNVSALLVSILPFYRPIHTWPFPCIRFWSQICNMSVFKGGLCWEKSHCPHIILN